MMSTPLQPSSTVRAAVLACGKAGQSPQEVIALLIKISVEISQSTSALTEDELQKFVTVLWELAEEEKMSNLVFRSGEIPEA